MTATMKDSIKKVSAFTDDSLSNHDAVEISRLIAKGELCSLDVIRDSIARSRRVNPLLNAVVTDSFDQAVSEGKGYLAGPFTGVPTFFKDNEQVYGLPTLRGSRAIRSEPSEVSSALVSMFETLGMVSLGKSTMPEFGLTASTESLLSGATCNPWDISRTPGGSSGGAAALVASGVVPLAHGNDGGGSIRVPAACCGIVGFKPTRDRLGVLPASKMVPIKLFTQGVLTRTVRDTAVFYQEAEKIFKNTLLPEIGRVPASPSRPLKIACISNLPGKAPSLEPDVYDALLQTAGLCTELGHHVELIDNPFPVKLFHDFAIYWAMLAFIAKFYSKKIFLTEIDKKKIEPFTTSLTRFFMARSVTLPAVIRRLGKFTAIYEQVMDTYDIILSPTTCQAAPKIGYLSPELPFSKLYDRLEQFVPFTCYQNISGAPGISMPLHKDKQGLPIGMHFGGKYGMDSELLALAYQIEEVCPFITLDKIESR
jgi:amidase